jgi:type 1 glutamine amidotransferase
MTANIHLAELEMQGKCWAGSEIYEFTPDTARPSEREFLLALGMHKMKNADKGNRKMEGRYPGSWVSTYEKGRTFYCSLGHRQEIFWNPAILKHYLAGIQYVLEDLQAPQKTWTRLCPLLASAPAGS